MILLLNACSPTRKKPSNCLKVYSVKISHEAAQQVKLATKDACQRLLKLPRWKLKIRMLSKQRADEAAIRAADNLRQLLLVMPLGPKTVLPLDPGFRTGCKLVVLDKQGNRCTRNNIPHSWRPPGLLPVPRKALTAHLTLIAIGNGNTAAETFARPGFAGPGCRINGQRKRASFIPASAGLRNLITRTAWGAVDGRRLMDPLMNCGSTRKALAWGNTTARRGSVKTSADGRGEMIAVKCRVGVEVNTASSNS